MTGALSQQMCWTWHTRDAATVRGPFPGSSTALATLSEPALKEEEEEEEEEEEGGRQKVTGSGKAPTPSTSKTLQRAVRAALSIGCGDWPLTSS